MCLCVFHMHIEFSSLFLFFILLFIDFSTIVNSMCPLRENNFNNLGKIKNSTTLYFLIQQQSKKNNLC